MIRLISINDLDELPARDLESARVQCQLIPRIEMYLEDRPPDKRALSIYSASDIGSDSGKSPDGKWPMGCGRLLYYRRIGEVPEERVDNRIMRIYDTGKAIHEQLQGYLHNFVRDHVEDEDEVFFDEVSATPKTNKLAKEYLLSTTTDGIYEMTVRGYDIRFGLEIKSIKDELYKHISSSPKREHVVQSHVYMKLFDLPIMIILYYNKNDSQMLEHNIMFDPAIWEQIVKKLDYIEECVATGTRPPTEGNFFCRSCRYAHICEAVTSQVSLSSARRILSKGGRHAKKRQ